MTQILLQANPSSSVDEKMDEKKRMLLERKRRNQMYSKNGLKYQNLGSPNENSYKQTNSKICSKAYNRTGKRGNLNHGPLKQSNNRNSSKVKNMPGVQLYGSVIQKVDYYPKKKKTNTETKKSPVKTDSLVTNDYNSMSESESLQILASRYSKFLQEKFGSNQNSEQSIQNPQISTSPKSKKQVTFEKNVGKNGKKHSSPKIEKNSEPKLALQQSITASIERPDIPNDESLDDKNDIIANENETSINNNNTNSIQSMQKMEMTDITENSTEDAIQSNDKNKDLFDDDSNDEFNFTEPKTPPKPIIHNEIENQNVENRIVIDNSIFQEAEREKELIKELLKKREAIESRINNTLALDSKPNISNTNVTMPIQKPMRVQPSTPKVDDSYNLSSNMPTDSPISSYTYQSQFPNNFSESDSDNTNIEPKKMVDLETDDSDDLNDDIDNKNDDAPNCVNLDPLNFVPKKRIFDMSASESDSEYSIIATPKKELPKPIENKKANAPRSPHVTWDISNCPPIVPKKSKRFEDQFEFNFINYDELNGFDPNAEDNHHNEETIDFNAPTNFSKAIKFPSNFLKDFQPLQNEMTDNELLHDDDDDYDEDTNDTIPNYSRITTMLHFKLDKDIYKDAVDTMNQYKMMHFALSINKKHEIEAVYSLRSDLRFATLIWGDGISKVYPTDILKFYTINIKTKQYELQRNHKFERETDAFIVE